MKFFQTALIVAFASVACAQVAYQPAGAVGTDEEYDPNPKYEFQYSVADPVTGDQKSQSETRDGDKVQGFYTVVESDGSLRRVEYYADAVSGFTATVSHTPGGQPPPAPATYQTYRPQEIVAAPVKVIQPAPVQVVAPAPVQVVAPAPVKVVAPAPVKVVPTNQYYNNGQYNNGYYNSGYYNPGYYQQGYYQQPAAYYQQPAATYYQQPAATYYQQPATYTKPSYNSGAGQAVVSGFFSSPYASYALPGSGNPTGAVTASPARQ